jgi:hypothetical protein
MSTAVTIVVVLVVLVVAAAVVMAALAAKRRRDLRESFGDEYDRTVERTGKRRDAERDLAERKAAHDELELRELSPASRARYADSWQQIQNRFVDAPVPALAEADRLLTQLMAERGYPTDVDVDQQDRLLSVEHTNVIESFRAGHAIELANQGADADTEQVRQAMLHFRSVFEDVLGDVPMGLDAYPEDAQDDVAAAEDQRSPVRRTRR